MFTYSHKIPPEHNRPKCHECACILESLVCQKCEGAGGSISAPDDLGLLSWDRCRVCGGDGYAIYCWDCFGDRQLVLLNL